MSLEQPHAGILVPCQTTDSTSPPVDAAPLEDFAHVEQENFALKAECARYRAALEQIRDLEVPGYVSRPIHLFLRDLAREALAGKPEQAAQHGGGASK